ncbi:hypothetical protein L2E82_25113 [Cichorium intybus]|uniref:Uncharacterized protein n=1 Tax=Cichorium intybus TaxID=13427 RepID=A0ACB9E252_CICIN|nr:hypothetical protein L2E82_25113 [Cichorium intybus]
MNTREDRGEENPGWLNLSLGQNLGETCSQSKATSSKLYACNFCRRKFYSSQALGGHQNAHRRERDTTRRYQAPKMVNLPMSPLEKPSFGVQAHSSVHTPNRNGQPAVARFSNHSARHGAVLVHHYAVEDPVDVKWPGGVYLDPQPGCKPSDQDILDLNLRL